MKKERKNKVLENVSVKTRGAFYNNPDDLVHDARTGCVLSRQGNDRGARVVETVDVTIVDEGGRRVTARVVKDALYRMVESGALTGAAYLALRDFQRRFDRAGYAHCTGLDLSGGGGGCGNRVAEAEAHALDRRDGVYRAFQLVGGAGSPMASVLFWYVGLGQSFDWIAGHFGSSKAYWRGVFFSAVPLLEQDYARRKPVKKIG